MGIPFRAASLHALKHVAVVLLAAGAVVGCSDEQPPVAPEIDALKPAWFADLKAIVVSPADRTLVVEGSAPQSLEYRATGTFKDGHAEDITAKVTFRVRDAEVGTFDANRFVSSVDVGGATVVSAGVASIWGQTTLTVVAKKRELDHTGGTVPANAASRFGGGVDSQRAPEIVYPNDGVVLPPNLGRLEIHFLRGANNTLFELSFSNAVTDVRVYMRCAALNEGCLYIPDQNVWRWLSQGSKGGDAIKITVRGTDDVSPNFGESTPVSMSFTLDDIEGGLYYWTTSGNTGIMRFDLAKGKGEAERFIGAEQTGGKCVGCHVLSRDGRKMIAEAGSLSDGRLLLFDVAKRLPLVPFASPQRAIFTSWSPDSLSYVGVYADKGATNFNLMVFDAASGQLASTIEGSGDAASPANHPDWSPEGDRIVFNRIGIPESNQRSYKGSIQMVSKITGNWTAPEILIPAESGKHRYYPSFAPTGDFIAFNESTCPAGLEKHRDCNGDTDPTASLWVVGANAWTTRIPLARANAKGKLDTQDALTTSFPKWSPFIFMKSRDLKSRVLWLSFSSSRRFGLRRPLPGGTENPNGALLWMTAVDPDKVARGEDPSAAAFALPFQDLTTSNHIAQWAERVVLPID